MELSRPSCVWSSRDVEVGLCGLVWAPGWIGCSRVLTGTCGLLSPSSEGSFQVSTLLTRVWGTKLVCKWVRLNLASFAEDHRGTSRHELSRLGRNSVCWLHKIRARDPEVHDELTYIPIDPGLTACATSWRFGTQ